MDKLYESRDAYYADHEFCPVCGSDALIQTMTGYLFRPGVPFKDENRATCRCGWVGKVHDLVPPGRDDDEEDADA